jgi:Mg/Co/Ni transporter MgtE
VLVDVADLEVLEVASPPAGSHAPFGHAADGIEPTGSRSEWDDVRVTKLNEVDGLTAADIVHRRLTSLPASTTVGELRDYFAASASRRIALLVDGDRYAGSIAASALPDDADATAVAADYAVREPTIEPQAPASTARDIALGDPSQRLPVVDAEGALVGIVAIDMRREGFCGT